jgi:hypothetical protein
MALFAGCQQEIDQIINSPADKVFTSESPVTGLITRTAMNDGSVDNIIDAASCSQLLLPVTITVNGSTITVNSQDDFVAVEHILDEYDDDNDEIDFLFPVTAVLSDFSQVIFTNEDQWEDFTDQCTEGADDDDIECIDFVYPVTLSVYNTKNQVSDVITFTDDKSLYEFIHDLDDDELAGFSFPLSILLADNTELTINSNNELEDAIESADGSCDEDDDNDHNDDDIDDSSLIDLLTSGQWKISFFFDEQDQTGNYDGYILTFSANGMVQAVKATTTVFGTWQTEGDNGKLELEMDFEQNQFFEELEKGWEIFEFNNQTIKMKDEDDNDPTSWLTFTRP